MKRKLGVVFMCLGTVLLMSALSLFASNERQALQAQRAAVNLLPQIIQQIQEEPIQITTEIPLLPAVGLPIDYLDPSVFEMTEVEIEGYLYIGYLSIPDLGLELPVMSDWSYNQLKIAPCRYAGSVYSDDLVLMAHNYAIHFGRLKDLAVGSGIQFTDMDGITTRYEVVGLEILDPADVEDMISGDYDLTLFTCTYGGRSRVTIRCDRKTD